jgi:hydrophobic/amphiphilic exporter-1 (mainly G- bacteria), HAE1 family
MIAFFVKHPTASNILMFIFLAVGALTLPNIQRETIPDATKPTVQIQIVYPGASPEEVYTEVVEPINDALGSVIGLNELRSEARDSIAIINAEMVDGGDEAIFQAEVEAAVSGVTDLPGLTETPTIRRADLARPALTVVVTAPMDDVRLKAYLEDMKDRLLSLDGISSVEVKGFSETLLRIEINPDRLRDFGLSSSEVVRRISDQSRDIPLGLIESGGKLLSLRYTEKKRSPKELEDLVLQENINGSRVYLRDIAEVSAVLEQPHQKARLEEKRAGILDVQKTADEDVLQIADLVREFLKTEMEVHPQVEAYIARDGADIVKQRLTLLGKNAVQGLFLVFLALFVFFDRKLSFWVAMSLPVAFLGAFAVVPYTNLTLNMLTSVGLLLALGLLMDDGIVIAESINERRKAGLPAEQAAIEGVKAVGSGVFSSFITTCCVLGPLAFVAGDIGKVLRSLPMMLILVVVISLIEAFFILPSHLSHALKGDYDRGWRRHVDRAVELFEDRILGPTVSFLSRLRYLTLGLALGVFIGTISLVAGGHVKADVFPALEGDVVVARLQLAPETPLRVTETAVDKIVQGLRNSEKALSPDSPFVNKIYVEYGQNTEAYNTGENLATVTARLQPSQDRDVRLQQLFDDWRERVGTFPDQISLTYSEPAIGPGGREIELRFTGLPLDELAAASQEAVRELSNYRGVSNLTADVRKGRRSLEIRQKPGALAAGLDGARLSGQLRTAFQGSEAYQFQMDGISHEVEVRLSQADRSDRTLDNFQALIEGGQMAPLEGFVEQTMGRDWSRIASVDGQLAITVGGDADERIVTGTSVIRAFQADGLPKLLGRYPGLKMTVAGRAEDGAKTGGSMARAGFVGLLGVFFLLSYQFRSYFEPLVVMTAIPFSLVGVIWGHYLFGLALSLPSVMGFLSLGGVVVNDSILLILYLKSLLAEGVDIDEAIRRSGKRRFLPIFLTSITTIAGLLPLLFEKSLQAQILIPLANAVCFGLLASTVLIVLVVPCLYRICWDLGLTSVKPVRDTQNVPNC